LISHLEIFLCLLTAIIEHYFRLQMAVAAVAHIYVYPAVPYRRDNKQNLNKVDSVADELEEDIEVAATSVKESVKDVVMGGGEHVSVVVSVCENALLSKNEIS